MAFWAVSAFSGVKRCRVLVLGSEGEDEAKDAGSIPFGVLVPALSRSETSSRPATLLCISSRPSAGARQASHSNTFLRL